MTLGTSPERKKINWKYAMGATDGASATEVGLLFTAIPFGNTATAISTHTLVAKTNRPSPPLGARGA